MRLWVSFYEAPFCEEHPLKLVFQINILIPKNPSKMGLGGGGALQGFQTLERICPCGGIIN
jgi:hypothetical protein